jgi:riboflavin synthase
VRIEAPAALGRYLAEKGSVAVDGVSLTVTDVRDGERAEFGVALIPYTLQVTTLGAAGVGDAVNLEVDVVARYVERLLQGAGAREEGPRWDEEDST